MKCLREVESGECEGICLPEDAVTGVVSGIIIEDLVPKRVPV